MNHLIVVAHPLIDSLTMKLARAFALQLQNFGHRHRTDDLYRMGFDPVLSADELEPASTQRSTPHQVQLAQAELRVADALTIIYPLWWAGMPAIMKGYIDRVFARGFAYEAIQGGNRGLLSGKRCVIITLSGEPMSELQESGQWRAIDLLQDTHVFRSSGLQLLEHLHIDSSEPPLAPQYVATCIHRSACLRTATFCELIYLPAYLQCLHRLTFTALTVMSDTRCRQQRRSVLCHSQNQSCQRAPWSPWRWDPRCWCRRRCRPRPPRPEVRRYHRHPPGRRHRPRRPQGPATARAAATAGSPRPRQAAIGRAMTSRPRPAALR